MTTFNEIEIIRTGSAANKAAAYLAACDTFEAEASKYANNENFVCRKSAEQVSLAYTRAQSADCEYAIYVAALAAEVWLAKAWNNAD